MSDAIARPNLFILREKYTWVDCLRVDYEDVSAEIRTNLSHDERAQFIESSNKIKQSLRTFVNGRAAQAVALDKSVRDAKEDKVRVSAISKRDAFIDEQDQGTDPFRIQRLELISPFIRDWNIGIDDGIGNLVKVPPPMDGGVASFAHTDDVVVAWLIEAIENGYRGGKGLRTRSRASVPSPELLSEQPPAREVALSS